MTSKAKADADPSREAQIDAALKALFEALESRPPPPVFRALVDQLERQSPSHDPVHPSMPRPATALPPRRGFRRGLA